MRRAVAPIIASAILAVGLGAPLAAQEPAQVPREQERPREPEAAPDTPPADEQEPAEDADLVFRPGRRAATFRVSGLVGFQTFTASNSFEAVLGTSSGVVGGGGGGVVIGRHLFVDVQVSRFGADGSRVFITDGGEEFDLGIPTTVTVTPIDVSAGWRFMGTPDGGRNGAPRLRMVPYAGGGAGFQIYKETSEFAEADDDVDETHGSYHVLGGVELPVTRHLGVDVGVLYRWVPDAIGSGGVSEYFDERDLGGAQLRFRVAYTF